MRKISIFICFFFLATNITAKDDAELFEEIMESFFKNGIKQYQIEIELYKNLLQLHFIAIKNATELEADEGGRRFDAYSLFSLESSKKLDHYLDWIAEIKEEYFD